MPRGNDKSQHREFEEQYSSYDNAEQLIAMMAQTRDPKVEAAGLKKVNVEATSRLDLDDLDVPEGHRVLDAAVRGADIVFVAEAPDGRAWKGTIPFDGEVDEGPRRSSYAMAAATP